MSEAPQTLEGWFVSHERYHLDWQGWQRFNDTQRDNAAQELVAALGAVNTAIGQGDSALYAVLGQKGDLLVLHFRETLEALKEAELALRSLSIAEVLRPAGSYISTIEVSLYEATAIAQRKLADRGVDPEAPEWDQAFAAEMAVQRSRLETRLKPVIPGSRWLCWYPMNKRRGETQNWYTLDIEARRHLMRGHGRIGHRYHGQVTQIIGGSLGLDDYEWGVSLFAEDPLAFKRLVTDMRFDEVSAKYADFGSFVLGRRLLAPDIATFLAGRMPG